MQRADAEVGSASGWRWPALLARGRRGRDRDLAAAEPDAGREVGGQVADGGHDRVTASAPEAQLDAAIGQPPHADASEPLTPAALSCRGSSDRWNGDNVAVAESRQAS